MAQPEVASGTGLPSDITAAARETCDRIAQLDPAISAFVPEPGRRSRLMGAATALRDRYAGRADTPALFGLPVGIKDVIRVDGLPTRAGSRLPPDVLYGPQAAVVSRLAAAGALVAGKTVTAEFAVLAPGPTRNPRAPEHTPGGSSSGSAAAVAAGLVPFALGTQTIASVIRPAAFCGIAGFRPTYGRVPVAGVIAYAPSLDTVGWLAADVAGLAQLAPVLCDDWQEDHAAPPPILGIPVGPYLECASPLARAEFAAQVAALRAAGIAVREVAVPDDFDAVMRALFVLTRFELARGHERWFALHAGLYQPLTAAMIRDGQAISPAEHASAQHFQAALGRHLADVMAGHGIDAWVTPAAPGPAPAGLGSTGDPVMSVPWSMAGLPAVSVPAGLAGGLPLGLQCVARAGADEQLLGYAALIERALAGTTAS